MSIPNRQIGWSTESNLLWQVAKQIQRLSGVIANSGVPGSQDLQQVTTLGANTNVNTIWESPTDPTNIYIEINTTDNSILFWDKNIDAANALTIINSYGFMLSLNGGFGTGGDGFQYMGAGGEIFQQFVMANGQNINFGVRELPVFDAAKQPTYVLNPDKLTAEYVLATTSDLQTVNTASNYLNDAAAQAGGIPVGGLYHTAGVVKIRLV